MKRLLFILMLVLSAPLWAAQAVPVGGNAALELRMHKLTKNLRCLVCQNETLADSQAGLAADLRRDIRKQMEAGKTNKQIIKYLTDRYGDFVLYKPPLRSYTLLLWFGPFGFLALGAGIWYVTLKRRRMVKPADQQVSAASLKQAAELLENND